MVNRTKKTQLSGLTIVCKLHASRGFTFKVINADNELECLRKDLMSMLTTFNVAAANENVPRMERRFRVFKVWIRAFRRSLPYVTMPKLVVVELMYFVVRWLNAFPS